MPKLPFFDVFNLQNRCAGVDTWLKLHARLIAVIPGLNRTAEACKKKFNSMYKLYKEDKVANGISGSNRHACKFYDSFDQWWHQTGTVKKHVTASANDSASVGDSTTDIEKHPSSSDTPTPAPSQTLATKVDKKNFQEQCYGVFMQMAENSSVMVKNFEKTNALLENVERQMDRLIDKL